MILFDPIEQSLPRTGSRADVESPAQAQSRSPARSPAGESPGRGESPSLVLSLFPGVDLLGRAFAQAGHCVVKGPDLLWDERIEDFHATPGRWDGVIGGPPCQNYSDANRRRDRAEGDRLVMEFLRVVDEAHPEWWLMENVRNVPHVRLRGYTVQRLDLTDLECGGTTGRLRHIQFGSLLYSIIRPLRTPTPRPVTPVPTLTTAPAGPGDRHCRRCEKMGFPPLPLRSLTPAARRRVIGNGVPLGMGLALARAVTARGPVTKFDCVCLCGRVTTRPFTHAGAACRQRTSRRRRSHTRELHYPPTNP